jgi:hypothetical protein
LSELVGRTEISTQFLCAQYLVSMLRFHWSTEIAIG